MGRLSPSQCTKMLAHVKVSVLDFQLSVLLTVPLFHVRFHAGDDVVHVVIWLDGGLLAPPSPKQILQIRHHNKVRQREQEGPAVILHGFVPLRRLGTEERRRVYATGSTTILRVVALLLLLLLLVVPGPVCKVMIVTLCYSYKVRIWLEEEMHTDSLKWLFKTNEGWKMIIQCNYS